MLGLISVVDGFKASTEVGLLNELEDLLIDVVWFCLNRVVEDL